MNKIIQTICFLLLVSVACGQEQEVQMKNIVETLAASGKSRSDLENVVNGIITSPDLYNTFWENCIKQVFHSDSIAGMFMKDLNIRFKTFETDDHQGTALGFTYDFNFDYTNFSEGIKSRTGSSFGLAAKGNVAFKKEFNPVDFLETKVFYSFSRYKGGVVQKNNDSVFAALNILEDKLAAENDMHGPVATALWEEFGKNLELSSQYYYALSPKFAYESNQDFSRSQFTPGIAIDLGAKAWNSKAKLAKANMFDYPFALLRLITGTDKRFTPYGSTIPVLQLAIDYVIPANDTSRENLAGNLNPFPRFSIEAGFRTFIKKIGKENIFFNANYKYFKEIGAPAEIVGADLDSQSYFIMALQSSSGFFVSYSKGKLPFDMKTNQAYSLGFSYKFN